MRLGIVGFGLIGGSLARAVHERQVGWPVVAWSPTGAGPSAAADQGVIERAATSLSDAVAEVDLIVLAAPPLDCLELLDDLARVPLREAATVTDVSSTKRRIVDRAAELGLPFAGGHPMAGRERVGYGAAEPDLFVDRPWIVCGDGTAADRVEDLARAVGARPVRMDAAAHDAAVAVVSHLPLVLSAALVEAMVEDSEAWRRARPLAAGGWASMTRLAHGDVEMGTGILATNGDEVASQLRRLGPVLDRWLADLEASDADRLRDRLATARDAATDDG